MGYKFYTSSEKTWAAMFDAVKKAEKSVHMETYIFEDNIEDYNFLKLLEEKAREGVRVKMILDSFGSFYLKRASVERLREAGVEVFFFSYFLHRMHRKILVIDDSVAFIGGVNFQRMSRSWQDLVVRINSGRLLTAIIRSFAKAYANAGGKDVEVFKHNKNFKGKARNEIIEHFPERRKLTLKKIYREHISKAEESILLVTPYFFPHRWLVGALHQAVLRGVNVEVLVPKTTNHFTFDRSNYFFMYRLSRLGVKFYLQESMNHAKVMIIDGREGIVGTNNLDFFSFDLNSEIGVFFHDTATIKKIEEIIRKWKKDSVAYNHELFRMKWYDYIISPIIALFTKIF